MRKTEIKSKLFFILTGTVIIPVFLLALIILTTLFFSTENIIERKLPSIDGTTLFNHPLNHYIELSNKTFYYFFKKHNNEMNDNYLDEIIKIYKQECRTEGINAAVAFSQMCLETNFLRYGGTVRAYQYNVAGIGATSSTQRGASFIDIQTGIRAHIQHIKAYSSEEDPLNSIVDPRFSMVKRKSAEGIMDLSGKWAVDPYYGKKILIYIMELYSYSNYSDK